MHPNDTGPAQELRHAHVDRGRGRFRARGLARRPPQAPDGASNAAPAAVADGKRVAHNVREAGTDALRLIADPLDQIQIAFAGERTRGLRLEQREIGRLTLDRAIATRTQVAANVDALRHVLVDVPEV